MTWSLCVEVLIFGLILCADSFSAAVAMGCRPFTKSDAIKFALLSGGAETLATLVGYWAGSHVNNLMASIDHWIAFGLLAAVAIHMAIEGITELRSKDICADQPDFHSFTKVLIVSVATSLDALGVGVSLGISQKPIAPFLVSIGAWAFLATIAGLYLARKLSTKFGPIFTIIGAIVLGIISIQMLSI
jgi:putative Mn2+ efflux pump MntP